MTNDNKSISDKFFELGTPVGGLLLYPGEIYDSIDELNKKVLKDKFKLGGWLEANGQAVNKNDYPELYEALGETYNTGYEDLDFFRLPDMRGLLAFKNAENQILSDDSESEESTLGFSDKKTAVKEFPTDAVLYYLIKAVSYKPEEV